MFFFLCNPFWTPLNKSSISTALGFSMVSNMVFPKGSEVRASYTFGRLRFISVTNAQKTKRFLIIFLGSRHTPLLWFE